MGKIKQLLESNKGKDILTIMIVILVGLGSFGLGRLSKASSSAGIKIEYPNQITSPVTNQEAQATSSLEKNSKTALNKEATGKKFFASKIGRKYYGIGCEAGKTIKQENRVYFDTRQEAESAGYELSSSCR